MLRAASAAAVVAAAAASAAVVVEDCAVVIAGGSLASLAAALAAANTTTATVCFLEMTDWPGGQMTSQGTSAIDFGSTYAHFPDHLTASFAKFLTWGPLGDPSPTANPGMCTVSDKCFSPLWGVQWAFEQLALFPNLKVFLSTVVVATGRDPATGRVANLTAVQRTPAAGTTGWERPLSESVEDWYSGADSAAFTKTTLLFPSPEVVIEGSEFGDVLMTSGLPVAQGVESPTENSTSYDDGCGQAATFTFFVSWGLTPGPSPDPVPTGSDEGLPFGFTAWSGNVSHAYTWRRSIAAQGPAADKEMPSRGDLMLVNSYNDMKNAILWLPLAQAQAQAASGQWRGGLNLTAVAMAEQRAFGWYHFMKEAAGLPNSSFPEAYPYLQMNYSAAGTANGLSKIPYLRESRRAVRAAVGAVDGMADFLLCHWPLVKLQTPTPGCTYPGSGAGEGMMGFEWNDRIGISEYLLDVHWMDPSFCREPAYFNASAADHIDTALFYMPFRALTVKGAPNLLVAGKNMATSFWANAAMRLHPGEWVSGTAAGAAAALMVGKGWTDTADVYTNVRLLQDVLNTTLGQPLDWTLPPNATVTAAL
jgi:hypothetical protein